MGLQYLDLSPLWCPCDVSVSTHPSAHHLLTRGPQTAGRIQLESPTAERTLQLGLHDTVLSTAPHDLGPGTCHRWAPWEWQVPLRWFGLLGAYVEGQKS